MNWVGGSRTRVLIKQERRKQKEYFEKKRLKSKMKLRGVLSPVKNSAVSLDLLNLYMVNQISCQKKRPETVRKQIHVNMNRDIKMPLRKHDLELPMSPHLVPSNLCIDDMENNLHYQRQGSKEELGPVKSSQVMDSYTMFEPQLSRIENCSFTPPSLSAELASNRDITRQNFIPRIVPSPQKVAYEKKQNEQLSNVNYSNSVISKLNKNQDAFSPSYKTAQFGTLFERLNSPGNRNFLTERPDIVTGEDCGTMDERRQSDFIIEKQSVQHILEENRKEVSNFLEDANQPTPSLLSENCDSFISENVINLLNIDQWSIKKTFDKCDFDSMGDICAVTSSDKNHSTERCIRSMFTNPELTFSNSTFNKTSYPEKCQPNKNYQKEYNDHERNNLSTSFEKDSFPASSEKKGKFESDYQEKAPQKTIQIYPVNRLGNIPLKELPSKQSWNFGLGELSEDEDQILQQIEDSNRRSIKTKETTNSFYLERMAKLPHDRIAKNNAKIHKQNENFHQFSLKDKTDQFPQSQCDSAHIVQDKSSNCTVQVARCDAWVQTESEPVMKEKLDAAIQCDIISKCKCISDVSSLCDVERCSENIKADTTGGQEILKNN
ncbi:regulator of DNA class I crossover intermediates 1-like isoform X3 [Equus asinus]|uniref:regulator of DNA class I crossover intermediates 1-like isoform X3 n=1 Tax=Equus asinus TaxID=9793 RepID=UPI0038F658C1